MCPRPRRNVVFIKSNLQIEELHGKQLCDIDDEEEAAFLLGCMFTGVFFVFSTHFAHSMLTS